VFATTVTVSAAASVSTRRLPGTYLDVGTERENGLTESDFVDIHGDQHWIRYLAFIRVEGKDSALYGDEDSVDLAKLMRVVQSACSA
jgi:hypothetical protein